MKSPVLGLTLWRPEQLEALPDKFPCTWLRFPVSAAGGLAGTVLRAAGNRPFRFYEEVLMPMLSIVAESNFSIQLEFLRNWERELDSLLPLSPLSVDIALPPETLLNGAEPSVAVMRLLRSCCGIACKRRLPLRMVTRVPGPAADAPGKWEERRRRLLLPLPEVADFHLHESNAPEMARSLRRAAAESICCWQLAYEAEAGNILTAGALNMLRELIAAPAAAVTEIGFDPGRGAGRTALERLSDLLTENWK